MFSVTKRIDIIIVIACISDYVRCHPPKNKFLGHFAGHSGLMLVDMWDSFRVALWSIRFALRIWSK